MRQTVSCFVPCKAGMGIRAGVLRRSAKADEERRDVCIPHFSREEMGHKVQHPPGTHTPNPPSSLPTRLPGPPSLGCMSHLPLWSPSQWRILLCAPERARALPFLSVHMRTVRYMPHLLPAYSWPVLWCAGSAVGKESCFHALLRLTRKFSFL